MKYKIMLQLQKSLYFNVYLYITWIIVTGFFLYIKFEKLGHLSKYLSITVFTLLTVIEAIRLYLGQYGNILCRVPELAGFLMLTVLMQMPLVSFFLFNSYLESTPTQMILHLSLWSVTIFEIIYSFLALKHASSVAKSMYLWHPRDYQRKNSSYFMSTSSCVGVNVVTTFTRTYLFKATVQASPENISRYANVHGRYNKLLS